MPLQVSDCKKWKLRSFYDDSFARELIDLWDDRKMEGVVFFEGEGKGFLLLQIREDEAVIRGLYVKGEARGQGIGRELLEGVISYFTVIHLNHLLVNITKGAEKLYKTLGFIILGPRKDFPEQQLAYYPTENTTEEHIRKMKEKIQPVEQTVEQIAATHLGQRGGEGYKDQYDPTLLVKIPRHLNRDAYGIGSKNLPFVGMDVWNAYEVSVLTEKGRPVVGILKLTIPAQSETHVESKSLKLYLNSFNMSRLGQTKVECIKLLKETITKDLSELMGTKVDVQIFTKEDQFRTYSFEGYDDLDSLPELDTINFVEYHSDHTQLKWEGRYPTSRVYKLQSSLLRSNCRVTHQPDWGDVYIQMKTDKIVDQTSIIKYIVSHRTVSHFHEEICEMIYTHLQEAFEPEELMVACLYTRRGGLDINPVRASHLYLIPSFLTYTERSMLKKTMRQ